MPYGRVGAPKCETGMRPLMVDVATLVIRAVASYVGAYGGVDLPECMFR